VPARAGPPLFSENDTLHEPINLLRPGLEEQVNHASNQFRASNPVQAVELDIHLSVFHRAPLAASVARPGQIPPEDMSSS
jgi:hypothetical protein